MLSKFTNYARSIVTSPKGGPVSGLDQVPLIGLSGERLAEEAWRGKVLLFVNVASRCGLTPQYADLVKLQQDYAARGFTVIGVPCNQFMGQEPGSASEIASFCAVTYGVDFPLLEKADVNGADRSTLYRFLVDSKVGGGERISWNFEKFLVGRDGAVVARFAPRILPSEPAVKAAIEGALGR
jgi:glutathione peroxidase